MGRTAGQYRNHTYQGIFVVSQPLYTGGALQAQNRIAKADEKLDQLSEELTRDQIHYQSDAFYWNASSARAMLNASAQYQEIVENNMKSSRIASKTVLSAAQTC